MELGTYIDGRPLTYDQVAGTFAVGDAPVNVDQVRGYSAAGQIAWARPSHLDWFHSSFPAAPVPAPLPAPIDRSAPAPVALDPVTSGQADAAERIQATIPGATLWPGFMEVRPPKPYTLILTDRRVILARNTTAGRKQRVADAHDSAKSEGEGFLGQLTAQMGAWLGWDEERYLSMTPDQALDETTGNFAIERLTITRVSVKTKTIDRWTEGGEATYDWLTIQTRSKKYKFTVDLGKTQAKKALRAAGMI